MRRYLMIVVVCGAFGLAGCGTDTTTRLAAYDRAVGQLQAASSQIDSRLAAIDAFLDQAKIALADPNLGSSSAEILAGIELALGKRDEAITVKAKIDTTLTQIRTQIDQVKAQGSVDVSDEISLIGGGLVAAGQSSGGQLGAWLTAIGGVLAGAAGLFRGNRKAGDATRITARVIASVDSLLASGMIADPQAAKKLLADDQGTTIATAVKAIKEG